MMAESDAKARKVSFFGRQLSVCLKFLNRFLIGLRFPIGLAVELLSVVLIRICGKSLELVAESMFPLIAVNNLFFLIDFSSVSDEKN